MESLDSEPCSMDELLNFSSDIDDEDDRPERAVRPVHELVEEELEWISNKDAFPAVESFVGIIPDHAPSTTDSALKHLSPVSVLEGSNVTSHVSNNTVTLTSCFGNLKAPRRARSKRRCRRRHLCWSHQPEKPAVPKKKKSGGAYVTAVVGGRKCQHCGAEKTPQWRAGPQGAKTLCNACGVRFKSGRLVPEYRPASSPSFSSELHSNSHRKIMEMRGRR